MQKQCFGQDSSGEDDETPVVSTHVNTGGTGTKCDNDPGGPTGTQCDNDPGGGGATGTQFDK